MKSLILLFCTIAFLHAGIFDFLDVSKAKKSYESKDYKSAIRSYKKLEGKQGAAYDLANSYYKNKQYKQALEEYQKVTDKSLEFKKLHNMGNTYAHLGKIDDAIKSYENALKIKKDKDTQYNLDLLKKQKKKQQKKKKKQQQNNKKQNNKNQNNSKQNNKNNKNNKNNQNKNNKEKKQNKDNRQNKNDQQNKDQQKSQNRDKKKSPPAPKKQNKKETKGSIKKAPPISDMEERKYKNMLDNRGINTLMLPIKSKGDDNHEENPW
ncbi:MAG: tetratricopeptide repeat protein [Sulfurospirillaceae bacterium]|nr:tetratricopeptide repeat protein [Sulfurospirillaceae bacterium]